MAMIEADARIEFEIKRGTSIHRLIGDLKNLDLPKNVWHVNAYYKLAGFSFQCYDSIATIIDKLEDVDDRWCASKDYKIVFCNYY